MHLSNTKKYFTIGERTQTQAIDFYNNAGELLKDTTFIGS